MSMQIKLWGVRGSLPSPLLPHEIETRTREVLTEFVRRGLKSADQIDEFLRSLPGHELGGYGGNTASVQVTTPTQTILIDAGSGLRRAGDGLLTGPLGRGQGEAHVFFTHFHWDHVVGLPFFSPLFIPGNRIHFYAVQDDLEENIRAVFRKPTFPVPFEKLGAEIHFHKLEPRKPFQHGDLTLTPYKLDHPDPCWGYKIEHQSKTFSYCVDTEATRASREDLGEDLPLYQGVDAMVFDAQYTILDAAERVDWGHAAAAFGLDIAMREGIKKVYFVHHDPAADDKRIFEAEQQARDYYESRLHAAQQHKTTLQPVDWQFAQEGTLITL
jgi:phosphoribosyl 1,2-cyclic phosphodiesterase